MRIILIILVLISSICFAKQGLISWSGGISGQPSKAFYSINSIIEKKQFVQLEDSLKSNSISVQFLSVLALERLNRLDIYKFSESSDSLINNIKDSENELGYFNGCVIDDNSHYHTLKNIFFWGKFTKVYRKSSRLIKLIIKGEFR